MPKLAESTFSMELAPPTWALPAGAGGGALAGLYFLVRAATGFAGGLGLLPYMFLVAGGAGFLLLTSRHRIVVENERLTSYSGKRIRARVATKDIVGVHPGLLGKVLQFSNGQHIRVPDYWPNAQLVTSYFSRRAEKFATKGNDPAVDASGGNEGKRPLSPATARALQNARAQRKAS